MLPGDAETARLEMAPVEGGGLIAVSLAALLIKALPDLIAAVRRQLLPAVPFFAQSLFILRRELLPAIDVSPDSFFFFRC